MSKRALCASALLGTALFVGGCVAEKPPAKGPSPAVMSTASPSSAVASPSGTAASPSGAAASPSGAVASPSGAAASPSGTAGSPSGTAASPVAVAPSGKPTAPPPPGPGPTGAPPKVEMKAEAKPKYFLDSTKPDQAGLMRVFVLEDGAIKPGAYSAKADQPVTLFINNYGKSAVTLEVTGGSVSQKATAGSNQMGQLSLKLPAGEYKITVGEKKATLTVK